MSERNEIQRAVDQFGQLNGMEKHSGSWYRTTSEVVEVITLQKSQYGLRYYLNLGFWIRSIEQRPFPKDVACHIRGRVGRLLPMLAERLELLLDLESGLAPSEQFNLLLGLLSNELMPLLDRGGTTAGLRSIAAEGGFNSAGVRGPALELLQIQP